MKLNLNTQTVILIEVFILALLIGFVFNINLFGKKKNFNNIPNNIKEDFRESNSDSNSRKVKDTIDIVDNNTKEIQKLGDYIDKIIHQQNIDISKLEENKTKLLDTFVTELAYDVLKKKNNLIYDLYNDYPN
jgi:hypothetical protein